MRQTEKFLLNLIDASDMLSAKPLNENMEKVEAALLAQQTSAAGKLMVATGIYTGDGGRSVTVQTPGFTPNVMIVSQIQGNTWKALSTACMWNGSDVSIAYQIHTDGGSSTVAHSINTEISFSAEFGKLTWSIPAIPDRYTNVVGDEGPDAINNDDDREYAWIAFGTAE